MTNVITSTEGNLWIAVFDTHRVMVYSPEGRHLKDVQFSAKNMTCTTWGGKNQDILFVTTGKNQNTTPGSTDEGGHIFRYRAPTGTKGLPKNEFLG